METPLKTANRLLAALGLLVDQEEMYLLGGYYERVAENRRRADPLVRQLVELAGSPGVSQLADRVAALLAQGQRHAAVMAEKMHDLDQEIRRTDQARHRTAQVAPAYKQAPRLEAGRFTRAC